MPIGVPELWNTYGDCENYGMMEGHKGAVLDLQWSRDSRTVYTASADFTLGTWDVTTGERLRKHVGHEDIINSISVFGRGGETLASGSDDCTIGVSLSLSLSLDILLTSSIGIPEQKQL
jgi:Prp8 binding protein